MAKTYNSELHEFVTGYFKSCNANIIKQENNYFVVEFPGGIRKTYTYIAKIAAENKDIDLLAKGSNALNEIIKNCASAAAFSEATVSYSMKSVASTFAYKKCCDLCAFFTVCTYKDKCCDFCSYYKECNTKLLNANFTGFGDLIMSIPLNVICFTFLVELSNDYSISQKVEKLIPILIDMESGKPLSSIKLDDLLNLDMKPTEEIIPLDEIRYRNFMNIARKEAYEKIRNQLEVFKKDIEGVLKHKITSIIDKYEDEYADNYTKSTLEQLNKLQEESLKLCEREIRGYAINCDYHLKNVLLMHTSKDIRQLFFKLNDTANEVAVNAEIFLNNVMIKCSECNTEIDEGVICKNGHTICKNCMEICSACGKSICSACDEETFLCSTCGDIICSDCVAYCNSCNAAICPSHSYRCATCGKLYCIDCYEICAICGSSICQIHSYVCNTCNSYVCSDHIHKCSVCGGSFCDDHIHECSICNENLCDTHIIKSAYSDRIVCSKHKGECAACNKIFSCDELQKCSICDAAFCPTHIKYCVYCNKSYCSEHINHCRCCGKDYCNCVQGVKCRLCNETYCPDCINENGLCIACQKLVQIDKKNDVVKDITEAMPELEGYKKYYLGTACEVKVLYTKKLLQGYLIVFDDNNNRIVASKKIPLFKFLQDKFIINRRYK